MENKLKCKQRLLEMLTLQVCFHIFDLDENGSIDGTELTRLLRLLCKVSGEYNTPEQQSQFVEKFVNDTFARFDKNGDGILSFDEFCTAAHSNPDIERIFTLRFDFTA